MNLLFLTFSPLSSNAGHLARLSYELKDLGKSNKITILCLGKNPDDENTRTNYPSVQFNHYPITFSGWEVKNIKRVIRYLTNYIEKENFDIVVLQMEVWELMRELGKSLKNKTPFATVLHAMPFLVSPLEPTKNFEKDVLKYANSGIEQYRKEYILKHYKEANTVLSNIHVIANNDTVAFYFKNYFKDIPVVTQAKSIVTGYTNAKVLNTVYEFDFAYMARMERGKGIEYLSKILISTSKKLSRKVSMVILGRADDNYSKEYLEKLLNESKDSKYFRVEYLGWLNNDEKQKILPKAGIFLYPSHYDNYPTVINEALSLGLPVTTWDIPFSRINYANVKSVKRIKLFEFDIFAESAIESLNNRINLSKESLRFVKSLNGVSDVARLDSMLYENIIEKERSFLINQLFPPNHKVIFLHAHCDDESFLSAGIMNELANNGRDCRVIYGAAAKVKGQEKTIIRQHHTRKSLNLIGIKKVLFMKYTEPKYASLGGRSLVNQKLKDITNELLEMLRKNNVCEPFVLVSYDSNGGYGNIDHKIIHKLGKELKKNKKEIKLYEVTINRENMINWIDEAKKRLPEKLIPLTSYWSKLFGTSTRKISFIYQLTDTQREIKRKALSFHTFYNTSDTFPLGLEKEDFAKIFGKEYLNTVCT